jgi:hypothetical protein
MDAEADLFVSTSSKQSFWDRHEMRAYFRAAEIGRRLVQDPRLVAVGREYIERFMRNDPHQAYYYRLWSHTLTLAPEDIARKLLEDSPDGALLRDSCPCFLSNVPVEASLVSR